METTTPQLTNPFHTIALDIIKKSIKTAVYIDDKIALPFENREAEEDDGNGVSALLCEQIYANFQENNILLDFCRYISGNEIPKAKFINRDLLVIDWNLDEGGTTHTPTFKIIEEAIKHPNLHFLCIYTQQPQENFSKIWLELFHFFSDPNDIESITRNMEDKEIGASDHDFKNHAAEAWTLFMGNDQDAQSDFSKNFNQSAYSDLQKLWKGKLLKNMCIVHSLNSCNASEPKCSNPTDFSFEFVGKHVAQINSTFITIINKPNSTTKSKQLQLFDAFAKAILTSHGLLTWIGIDLRNMLWDTPTFLSSGLNLEVEAAVVEHYKTLKEEDAKNDFLSFLRDLWIEQIRAHINTHTNAQFNTENLAAYFELSINSPVQHNAEALKKSYKLLNYFLNIKNLNSNNLDSQNIQFGDIFKISISKQTKYLLCVTPHCDCLRPEKNLHYYSFIEGNKSKNSEADTENSETDAEKDYYSFVRDDNNIISIKWLHKTVPIRIMKGQRDAEFDYPIKKKKDNDSSESNSNEHWHKNAALKYLGTLKENYAQRMANYAMGHNIRVGVNFVKQKAVENKTK